MLSFYCFYFIYFFFYFFQFFHRGSGKTSDHKYTSRKSILCLLAEKVQAVNCEGSRQGERRGGAGEANNEHALFMNALQMFLHFNPKENL